MMVSDRFDCRKSHQKSVEIAHRARLPQPLTLPLEPTTKRYMNEKCFYFGEIDRNQACHCERSCVKSESISIPMRRSQHARSGRFRYDIRRKKWASEERTVTLWYLSELKIRIFKALQSDWLVTFAFLKSNKTAYF